MLGHFRLFWTPLDHFGMLTSLPCLAIFVCFIGAFFGTSCTKIRIHLSPLMAGWMEFRVCWWKGWLGRVVNMAAPDVPGPVKPGAYDSAANGGRRGASLKGGAGLGARLDIKLDGT